MIKVSLFTLSFDMTDVRKGYRRLDGSELHHLPSTRFLGSADAVEEVTLLFVLRRRPDGLTPRT